MPPSIRSVDVASPGFVCGTLVNGKSLPNVACRRVYLGAPTINTPGGQVNTSDVMFGGAGCTNDRITADGSRDGPISIDNPSKIAVTFVTGTDKLEYRVEL